MELVTQGSRHFAAGGGLGTAGRVAVPKGQRIFRGRGFDLQPQCGKMSGCLKFRVRLQQGMVSLGGFRHASCFELSTDLELSHHKGKNSFP